MNKQFFSFFASLLISVAALSQKTVNDPNVEKRNAAGFHAISVSNGIDLYLSQGDEAVAVSASETKYRDHIMTEVKDEVLKIWYQNTGKITFGWGNQKLRAYVSAKNLDKLTGSGGSDIIVDGMVKTNMLSLNLSGGSDFEGKVEAAQLKVNSSGGSDVKIAGTIGDVSIDASGGSDFKGYELVTDICTLKASGGSDVYVTVNKELSADTSGGSDVYYKGNGVIRDIKSSGSSSIKKVTR